MVATLDELVILKAQAVMCKEEWKDCANLLWIFTKMGNDGVPFGIPNGQELVKEVEEVIDDEDLLDGNDRDELKTLLVKFTS